MNLLVQIEEHYKEFYKGMEMTTIQMRLQRTFLRSIERNEHYLISSHQTIGRNRGKSTVLQKIAEENDGFLYVGNMLSSCFYNDRGNVRRIREWRGLRPRAIIIDEYTPSSRRLEEIYTMSRSMGIPIVGFISPYGREMVDESHIKEVFVNIIIEEEGDITNELEQRLPSEWDRGIGTDWAREYQEFYESGLGTEEPTFGTN